MKIPNNNLSFVADNKIKDYLLNESHPEGMSKAKFFKHFGFNLSNIETFKESLKQHSIDRDIEKTVENNFGVKYMLKCEIETPDKRNPCIISVWLVEKGQQQPVLITAYRSQQ